MGHKLGEFSPSVYFFYLSGKGGGSLEMDVLTYGDAVGRGRILDIHRRRINEILVWLSLSIVVLSIAH